MKGWDERLTFENIAESYIKANVWLIVTFRSVLSGQPREFSAIFERADEIGDASSLLVSRQGERNRPQSDYRQGIGRGHRYEKTVFIDDVKSMQSPNYVPSPALVWFKTTDDINGLLAGTLLVEAGGGIVSDHTEFPVFYNRKKFEAEFEGKINWQARWSRLERRL